jgi:hypothetical protein
MPNGAVAKLSFAMCDPRDEDSIPDRFARLQGAHACGLITVTGVQGAPATPMVWIVINDQIAVSVGDIQLGQMESVTLITLARRCFRTRSPRRALCPECLLTRLID